MFQRQWRLSLNQPKPTPTTTEPRCPFQYRPFQQVALPHHHTNTATPSSATTMAHPALPATTMPLQASPATAMSQKVSPVQRVALPTSTCLQRIRRLPLPNSYCRHPQRRGYCNRNHYRYHIAHAVQQPASSISIDAYHQSPPPPLQQCQHRCKCNHKCARNADATAPITASPRPLFSSPILFADAITSSLIDSMLQPLQSTFYLPRRSPVTAPTLPSPLPITTNCH